jgi:hypothetical protein
LRPYERPRKTGRKIIRNAEAVYTDDWLDRGLSVIVSNHHILTAIHAAGGVAGEK